MAAYSVTIVAASLEAATRLRGMGLDLHERAARRRPDTGEIVVPAMLSDDEIQRVRGAGYRVDVGSDLAQVAAERAADVDTDTDRFAPDARAGAERAADGRSYDSAAAVGTLEQLMDLGVLDAAEGESRAVRSVLGGYFTPVEVETALQALASAYSGSASISVAPEQSWEGRSAHVLRIRAGTATGRIGVLVTGSMHAREWGGSDICLAFATNLLKSYSAGAPLKYGGKTFPPPR